MLDSRSVQKLSDETFNDENVVSTENAEKLLDVIRNATAEDVKSSYEDIISLERASAESLLRQKSVELATAQANLNEAGQRESVLNKISENQIQDVIA